MFRRLLLGATAGTLATVPMTMVMETLHRRLPGEPERPLPPREVAEAMAVKAGVNDTLSEREIQTLALASHVCYGAATGALFAAIAPRKRSAIVVAGTAYGLGVWAASYLGWLPALGIRQPVTYDPPARNGLMIAAHLAFGTSLGIILAAGSTSRGRARRTPASTPDQARA